MLEQLGAFIQDPENTRELYLVSAGLMVLSFSVLVVIGRLAPRDNSDLLAGNGHNVTNTYTTQGDSTLAGMVRPLNSGGIVLVMGVIAKLIGILGFLLAAWACFNS